MGIPLLLSMVVMTLYLVSACHNDDDCNGYVCRLRAVPPPPCSNKNTSYPSPPSPLGVCYCPFAYEVDGTPSSQVANATCSDTLSSAAPVWFLSQALISLALWFIVIVVTLRLSYLRKLCQKERMESHSMGIAICALISCGLLKIIYHVCTLTVYIDSNTLLFWQRASDACLLIALGELYSHFKDHCLLSPAIPDLLYNKLVAVKSVQWFIRFFLVALIAVLPVALLKGPAAWATYDALFAAISVKLVLFYVVSFGRIAREDMVGKRKISIIDAQQTGIKEVTNMSPISTTASTTIQDVSSLPVSTECKQSSRRTLSSWSFPFPEISPSSMPSARTQEPSSPVQDISTSPVSASLQVMPTCDTTPRLSNNHLVIPRLSSRAKAQQSPTAAVSANNSIIHDSSGITPLQIPIIEGFSRPSIKITNTPISALQAPKQKIDGQQKSKSALVFPSGSRQAIQSFPKDRPHLWRYLCLVSFGAICLAAIHITLAVVDLRPVNADSLLQIEIALSLSQSMFALVAASALWPASSVLVQAKARQSKQSNLTSQIKRNAFISKNQNELSGIMHSNTHVSLRGPISVSNKYDNEQSMRSGLRTHDEPLRTKDPAGAELCEDLNDPEESRSLAVARAANFVPALLFNAYTSPLDSLGAFSGGCNDSPIHSENSSVPMSQQGALPSTSTRSTRSPHPTDLLEPASSPLQSRIMHPLPDIHLDPLLLQRAFSVYQKEQINGAPVDLFSPPSKEAILLTQSLRASQQPSQVNTPHYNGSSSDTTPHRVQAVFELGLPPPLICTRAQTDSAALVHKPGPIFSEPVSGGNITSSLNSPSRFHRFFAIGASGSLYNIPRIVNQRNRATG